jgi:hypothetical protein
LKTNS